MECSLTPMCWWVRILLLLFLFVLFYSVLLPWKACSKSYTGALMCIPLDSILQVARCDIHNNQKWSAEGYTLHALSCHHLIYIPAVVWHSFCTFCVEKSYTPHKQGVRLHTGQGKKKKKLMLFGLSNWWINQIIIWPPGCRFPAPSLSLSKWSRPNSVGMNATSL